MTSKILERMRNTETQTQRNVNLKIFQSLEQIIFGLNENNINESVESSLGFYDKEFPYSFNFIICIYADWCIRILKQKNKMKIYISLT